ncbi:DUF397 domain-containing protein [Streptomyces sp. NPDC056738]|uniref:DUF397 domain-containing protein n=1 Tax=Streptomyces sp. NPDC056738 TaxID=3345933 RepID=UPI0036ACACE8
MTRVTSPENSSGLMWFKSSYSSSSEAGDCVEMALSPTTIHIRDSKNPGGARLAMTPAAWTAFVGYAAQR